MSESKQTVIDMGSFNKPQKSADAVGIGKISGQTIHITAYRMTRGKPTAWTPKDDIARDGLTEYHLIDTEETFKLKNSKNEDADIKSFFITNAIVKQIERVPNYAQELAKGNKLGPAKVGQKLSTKTKKNYWCLLFPGEEGY